MIQSNWNNITKEELALLAQKLPDAVIAQQFGVTKREVAKKRKEFGLTMMSRIADNVFEQESQLIEKLMNEKRLCETEPEIIRHDLHERNAHHSVVEAGDFVFIGHCCRNIGQSFENQINGSLDQLSERLSLVGLSLESVVQITAMFRDVHQIPVMEEIFRKRFNGKYPVRSSIQTEFAEETIDFQLDAVAYKG